MGVGAVVTRVHRGKVQVATFGNKRQPSNANMVALPHWIMHQSGGTPTEAVAREFKDATGCEAAVGEFVGCVCCQTETESLVVLFWLMHCQEIQSFNGPDGPWEVTWRDFDDAYQCLTDLPQRELIGEAMTMNSVDWVRSRGNLLGRILDKKNPQLARVREDAADAADEILHSAASLDVPYRREAQAHLRRALIAAGSRDLDTGWGQVSRARELLNLRLDLEGVKLSAIELETEVRRTEKLNEWRKEAVSRLLEPILVADGAGSPLELRAAQQRLQAAWHVRNEALANEYRTLTILRRHQTRLLWIGGVALGLAVFFLIGSGELTSGPIGANVANGWVMCCAMALGIVGAVISAAQRSSAQAKGPIPNRLSSNVASISRIPVGAVAGLLVWLAAFTALAPGGGRPALVLVGAFGAGFTERLVAPAANS